MMVDLFIDLYKQRFSFKFFYENLLFNINRWPEFHVKSETFLNSYKKAITVTEFAGRIKTKTGDIRVDLPIWFGDPTSVNKIVVFGLEPRDTNETLNIERVDNYVFATPFALERPNGPYYSAFFEAMQSDTTFIYFTDAVKTYVVSGDKPNNDKVARKEFQANAQREKAFLLKELDIIKPKKVIALGNECYKFLTNHLEDKYEVQKVRHPSRGGAKIAKHQFWDIIQNLD
ncbi:uracil-DNA glycosylase family protein [Sediminibacterium sp.]|uniref:uracil-DNA glycosylase family protein n=1 Tax=Sediminibacterium sp. TaxID=1917865 RepID=UPI003F71242A